MNTDKVKNMVVVFLCILTVYQTIGLWFENISGRNFFYTLFASQTRANFYVEDYDFTTPKNIVVGFGNNNFNKFFVDKEHKYINDSIEDVMKYIATNGEYIDTKNIDWDEILSSKLVICYYIDSMPMESYMKAMGAKSTQFFSNRQKSFDTLAIVPARSTGEYLKAYFIDTYNDKTTIFSYRKNKVSDTLYSNIENMQKQSNNISYVSTYQSGFERFDYNVFLPQVMNKNISYPPIKLYIPNETTLQGIEKRYIDGFFENPMAKWSGIDAKGVYMYCDESIVVRYYQSGLLEYADYSVNNHNTDNSLLTAFNVAIELMKKDANIYDSIYLANVSNQNGTWKFGFDYYFTNFPIFLSEEIKTELGINNIIEITVKNGLAVGYKHYICDIEISNSEKSVSIDFSTALSSIITENPSSITNIDDMYLAYVIDGKNEYSDVMWILDTSSYDYIKTSGTR